MAENKAGNTDPGLIQTLSSLQFGLVILIVIACVSVIGTILPQGRPPSFYAEHYNSAVNFVIMVFRFDNTYRSPLFIGLLALFGLNLFLCSVVKFPSVLTRAFKPDMNPEQHVIAAMPVSFKAGGLTVDDIQCAFAENGFSCRKTAGNRLYGEKGRLGYLGASTVHISLLLMLAGGMASLLTGVRGHIILEEGERTDSAMVTETLSIPLGFELSLDKFEVEFYEGFPERPKSYTSSVTVTTPDGGSFGKEIRVNSPLMMNNLTVYQSSYGIVDPAAAQTADNDTAHVSLMLKGAPESMPPVAEFSMTMGETYPVPGFGDTLGIRLAELHRSFRRGGGQSSELNPAVRVDILANGEARWSVYAFVNFPGLNMPMYDDLPLSVTMTGIGMFEQETAAGDAGEKYYTVLGVVRDRGIPLMWAGSIVMMIGLLLSFYLRPRRIWVVEENGTVFIGGRAKGDTGSLEALVRRALKTARGNKPPVDAP